MFSSRRDDEKDNLHGTVNSAMFSLQFANLIFIYRDLSPNLKSRFFDSLFYRDSQTIIVNKYRLNHAS